MSAAALCIAIGSQLVALPATSFTLSWQHTVEKITWEEDYLIAGAWLYLTAARVGGSGAGMEPPPNAMRVGKVWQYAPVNRWHAMLNLARSEFGADYSLCIDGRCTPMQQLIPGPPQPTAIVSCAARDRLAK